MGDCKSPRGGRTFLDGGLQSAGTPNGVYSYALKGQKLLAQGTALGVVVGAMRPVRAKALKYEANSKLLPLQGDRFPFIIPRAVPWARSFCPFRAYGFQRN